LRNYLKKLTEEILDEHNLFVELTLVWIAGMLTILVGLIIISMIFGGSA